MDVGRVRLPFSAAVKCLGGWWYAAACRHGKKNMCRDAKNFGRANTLSDFPKAPKVPKQFERGKKKATFFLS